MRAVVTGGRGFVGRHLVAHLEVCGDSVVPLDRRGPVPFDVTDADSVRTTLRRAQPDAVYHLAAMSHVGDSWKAPGLVFRVNAEGTLNVLRACVDLGIPRVLVVGSAEEYGRVDAGDLPISEDAPLRPITPYGASKVAADFLALQSFLGDGIAAIRARPFNHTGPGQDATFLVPALATRIARAERDGAKEIPVGSLAAVRDVTDVRDIVRAYRLLVERGEPGAVYNVCSGRGVAVSEIAQSLLERAHHEIRLVVDPELVRPVEVTSLVGDNRRLREVTDWMPAYELSTTLADVLDAARAAT
jgi:GDP-4-dehydro-6-deoxy-D-mannose reductase